VQALSNIDLKVERGEFVAFIGPSGCGKTTLLRAVADLETPTGGVLQVNGMSAQEARANRAYGYVFQAPALYPWRTVADNIALPLEIMATQVRARPTRRRGARSGQPHRFRQEIPVAIVGRHAERASIARALSFDPELLLMDEPFGALDEIVRDMLNQQLLVVDKTRKTVLFVTHSIPRRCSCRRGSSSCRRAGTDPDIIETGFPRQRPLDIRETPEFLEIANRVRHGLRAGHSYDD